MPGRAPVSRAILALALAGLLCACSTTQIDSIPNELGGLPQGSPARPAEAPTYPAVHDMPPTRSVSLLDAEQQKRLEDDLINLRNRQPNQEKNRIKDAKKKADMKKKADAKAAGPLPDKDKRKARRSKKQAGAQAVAPAGGQAASGAPPWPVPAQPTGASPRP